MGGASQGNLGIAFGGRRQITTAGPHVPNLVEKERQRKEKEAEAERQRQEEELRRRAEIEAEEERARLEEERRWEDETRRAREAERRKAEEEKRRWAEEERQWKLTEEKRRREEKEAEARLLEERQMARKEKSNPQLHGQYLSQYQDEQETTDKARIRQLEKQLEQARQREAAYERGRQGRGLRPVSGNDDKKARSRSRSRPAPTSPGVARQDSWSVRDEQNFLSTQWSQHQKQQQLGELDEADLEPPYLSPSPRPLPDPTAPLKTHRTGGDAPPALAVRKQHTGSRPLPDPTAYASNSPETARPRPQLLPQSSSSPLPQLPPRQPSPQTRTDRFHNPAPAPVQPASKPAYTQPAPKPAYAQPSPKPTYTREPAPPTQPKKTGPPKSLLEREMELERQRQREWEEAQRETAKAVRPVGDAGVDGIGGGVGGRWDVSQWAGFTGGDSQNRGAQGIGAGRRQIVGGPRPLPEPPR
jgi:hypothetical protein